jgi:transcriptional regulator with XRE-family HTH domain
MKKRQRPYPSLRHWRDENCPDQRSAAEQLGVSQGYYSRLERQKLHPHRTLAKAISDKTGVPIETILGVA